MASSETWLLHGVWLWQASTNAVPEIIYRNCIKIAVCDYHRWQVARQLRVSIACGSDGPLRTLYLHWVYWNCIENIVRSMSLLTVTSGEICILPYHVVLKSHCELCVCADSIETAIKYRPLCVTAGDKQSMSRVYIWGFRARQHLRSLTPVMNDFCWLWWPVIFGDGWDLSFPNFCLTDEEKPGKTSTRKTDLTGDRTPVR